MKFDRDVWFRENSRATLQHVKQSISASSRQRKRFSSRYLSVISSDNPADIFKKWVPSNFKISIKDKENFSLIELTKTIKQKNLSDEKRERKGVIGIFKNAPTGAWSIFTNESYGFFKLVLMRFVEFHHPDISPIYLSTDELKSLFSRLSKKYSCEIFSKKAITKNPRGTEMNFTKPYPVEYVFDESYDNENYVDLIEFLMRKEGKTLLHASISRSGVSTFHSGDIELFYNDFLNIISEIGASKSEIFSNKEQTYGNREVHPINVVYDKEVFISSRDNKRLINVLSHLKHSSVAIIHNNPYVHLTLLDYLDGSSFDIFVDSVKSISIIPRFNASFSSLNKVVQRVFEGFGEGELIEEKDQVDSLESVFLNE